MWKPVLFVKEICKYWGALVTGGALIGLLGIWQSTKHAVPPWVYWTIAVLALVFASGQAWIAKYEELERLTNEMQSRAGRPDLTTRFEVCDSPPRTMLRLQNSSHCPAAVGISIEDIRNGDRILRFSAPSSVLGGVPAAWIDCDLLENGVLRKNDVLALFSGDKSLAYRFNMRIRFSNLESKSSQKSWVLSFPFWYDKPQQKLCNRSAEY